MDPASAVAGLISLAGLVLEGVQTLRTFCLDFKHANRDINETAEDLHSLAAVLAQLQDTPSADASQPSTLSLLRQSIIACKDDIDVWLSAIEGAHFHDKKGIQRFLKRLTATLDWSRRGDLRRKIASHRAQLSLVLELFGRDADLKQQRQLEALRDAQNNHFDQSMQSMEKGFGKMKLTQASLDQIDSRLDSMQKTLNKALSQRKSGSMRRKGVRPLRRGIPATTRSDSHSKDVLPIAKDGGKPGRPQMLMRMVKTAFLVQEANGKPVIEMLATVDHQYESANDNTKIAMIKYIQSLRLLVWLLRRDNLACTARFYANDDSPGILISIGSLNNDYKRSTLPSEFLRWRQFSLVQKLYSPLHGGSVPADSAKVVQSYFMSNDYGRDLFEFYLSLPKISDVEESMKTFENDSNEPDWLHARRQRMSLFMRYLGIRENQSTHKTLQFGPDDHDNTERGRDMVKGEDPSPSVPRYRYVIHRSFGDDMLDVTDETNGTSLDSRTQHPYGNACNVCSIHDIKRSKTLDSAIDVSHDTEMIESSVEGQSQCIDQQRTCHLSNTDLSSQKARPATVEAVAAAKLPHALQATPSLSSTEHMQPCPPPPLDTEKCCTHSYLSEPLVSAVNQAAASSSPDGRDGKHSKYPGSKKGIPGIGLHDNILSYSSHQAEDSIAKRRKYMNQVAQKMAAEKLQAERHRESQAANTYHKPANASTHAPNARSQASQQRTAHSEATSTSVGGREEHGKTESGNAVLADLQRLAVFGLEGALEEGRRNVRPSMPSEYHHQLQMLEIQNQRRLRLARGESERETKPLTQATGTEACRLGGWRTSMSMQECAHNGAQLMQALSGLKNGLERDRHSQFDWLAWNVATNWEAQLSVQCVSREEYQSSLAALHRQIQTLVKSYECNPKPDTTAAFPYNHLEQSDKKHSQVPEHGQTSDWSTHDKQNLQGVPVHLDGDGLRKYNELPRLAPSPPQPQMPMQHNAAHRLRDTLRDAPSNVRQWPFNMQVQSQASSQLHQQLQNSSMSSRRPTANLQTHPHTVGNPDPRLQQGYWQGQAAHQLRDTLSNRSTTTNPSPPSLPMSVQSSAEQLPNTSAPPPSHDPPSQEHQVQASIAPKPKRRSLLMTQLEAADQLFGDLRDAGPEHDTPSSSMQSPPSASNKSQEQIQKPSSSSGKSIWEDINLRGNNPLQLYGAQKLYEDMQRHK